MGFAVYHVSLKQVFFFLIPRFSPLCCHCLGSTCSSVRHPRNAYLVSTFDSDVGIPHHKGVSRLRLKCDGTRAETRFRLSAKRTSPFKSAGASVRSTTDSRGVRIGGSNAGCAMFRGSVKSTGYPIHSSVSPSLPLPCVTVCHHILTGVYNCIN